MNFFRKSQSEPAEKPKAEVASIPFSTAPADNGVHFTNETPMSRNLSIGVADSPNSAHLSTPLSMPVSVPLSRPVSVAASRPIAVEESDEAADGKTRLLGFDTSDGRLEMFGAEANSDEAGVCFKPVGFLMVVEGPGEGYCFALQSGMSTIGRSADQTVALDFGDRAVSRSNHAAVVYDPETRKFLLGHGGKSNIVRLNGTPLVMTEAIETGALIQIGATKMRFVALCGQDFTWQTDEVESDDDAFI